VALCQADLPVLYEVNQPNQNVVVFRGSEVSLAQAGGLLPLPPGAYSGLPPPPPPPAVVYRPAAPAPLLPPPATYARISPPPPAPVVVPAAPLVAVPAPAYRQPPPPPPPTAYAQDE